MPALYSDTLWDGKTTAIPRWSTKVSSGLHQYNADLSIAEQAPPQA